MNRELNKNDLLWEIEAILQQCNFKCDIKKLRNFIKNNVKKNK